MRLAELSARSGVSTATIKYYLREGLLPPGRRVNATQSSYDEGHLRKLRLVRAMVQVGRMPVATVREVLRTVDDESLDHHTRLGVAVSALPHGAGEPPATDPATEEAARRVADELLAGMGWSPVHEEGTELPAYRMLVAALTRLAGFGYPWDVEHLAPYARLARQLAVTDLDHVERYGSPEEQMEAAVALTVLYEPVLLGLRRLADVMESHRRFTGAPGATEG
ncbi:MerR family transcriptional regulator [Streptomyces sp. NPDC005955]|uniref:MerR family transcriptional regulator n=1 Tax=Streptomyces sp. NPDC005955 TaxID=3364738 RepID=UPI0036997DAB